jgi:hypothetical protein
MAKVLYGNGVASILGSIAGNTYSNNRYGSYIRNKTPPVQPRSEYQLNQRALFSAISASWRGLTPDQQAGWNAAASSKVFTITNRFGNSISLSGATLYNQFNLNLSLAGQSMITDVPAPIALPVLTFKALAVGDTGQVDAGGILANGVDTFDGFSFSVYSTTNLSTGKTFVSNLYRLLVSGVTPIPASDAGLINVSDAFTARYGVPVTGSQIFMKLVAISNTTGQATVAASSSCIVS